MLPMKKDKVFVNGLLLLIISLIVFCLPLLYSKFQSGAFIFFIINFAIAIGYLITLKVTRRLKGEENAPVHSVCLILFLISAYSLNQTVNVFANSANWFAVVLVTISVNYLLLSSLRSLPVWSKHLMFLMLGISMIVFSYLCMYLFPVYGISLLCSPVLGISLHVFVPGLILFSSIKLFINKSREDSKLRWTGYAGMAAAMATIITVVSIWDSEVSNMNANYRKALVNSEKLPAWIEMAKRIPKNSITEKIFESELVYELPNPENFFWDMPRMNFGEKIHDPLVVIGSIISGSPAIEEMERIKILESRFDVRHQTEQRLWAGEDLVTEYVNSNLRIWPEYALAYTEKTITVFADQDPNSWQSRNEAIYTFQLPEGGVVTSLSLWINGKEEKALLTTRGKADKAYNTIVGVESRDPSLVKWQEGNRVSVRVFPVMSNSRRTFKIGITSPLRKEGNEFVYDNITFKGPETSGTKEDVQIALTQSYQGRTMESFASSDDKHFERSGKYRSDWSIKVEDTGLATGGFSFNGNSYHVSELKEIPEKINYQCIYFDINSAWTKDEYEMLIKECAGRKLYAYTDELTEINSQNKDRIFENLSHSLFSLFPFYKIKDPGTSLVISKNTQLSPNLKDLEGSDFLKSTQYFFSKSPDIKLYNLNNGLSPYLRSLVEYRAINYSKGDMQNLLQMLSKSEFPAKQEDSSHIILPNSNIMITQTAGDAVSQAPDHLLRLFAYNHLMQSAGKRMLDSIPEDDALVEEAKLANIVTPVSSLIVLESEEDYERFQITKNNDALGNASLKSKGAVPEPHEWLLIIVGAVALLYIKLKIRITGARN